MYSDQEIYMFHIYVYKKQAPDLWRLLGMSLNKTCI